MINVYFKTENGVILGVSSGAFLPGTDGWIKVDEGDGDRYLHAAGNYLSSSLTDEQGRYRYKLVNGVAVERTADELNADELPAPVPSEADRLAALETTTQQQAATLNEVVTILEAIV